jgi:hypothetical protein
MSPCVVGGLVSSTLKDNLEVSEMYDAMAMQVANIICHFTDAHRWVTWEAFPGSYSIYTRRESLTTGNCLAKVFLSDKLRYFTLASRE